MKILVIDSNSTKKSTLFVTEGVALNAQEQTVQRQPPEESDWSGLRHLGFFPLPAVPVSGNVGFPSIRADVLAAAIKLINKLKLSHENQLSKLLCPGTEPKRPGL